MAFGYNLSPQLEQGQNDTRQNKYNPMNNTQIKSVIFGGHFQVSFQLLTNTFYILASKKLSTFFSKLTFKKKSSQLFSLRMMEWTKISRFQSLLLNDIYVKNTDSNGLQGQRQTD